MLSVESTPHHDSYDGDEGDGDEAATCSTDVTVATVGTSSCYSNPATTATTTATGEEDEKTMTKKKQQRKSRNRKQGIITVVQADEFSFLFGDVISHKNKKNRHRRKRNDNTIVAAAASTSTTTTPASMGNSREDWNTNHCSSDKEQVIDRYDEEEGADSEAGMEVDMHGIVDSSSTTTAAAATTTSIGTPRDDCNGNNWSSDEEQTNDNDDDEENEDSEAGMEVDVHGIVTEVAGKRISHKQRLYQVRQTFLRKAKIATVGGSMVVLGVAMIAVPGGPSVPTVVAGLRVLGTEFACAKTAEANVVHATNQVVDQSKQFCARALDHHATTNPNVFQTLATTKTHFVERHPHLVQSAHQAKVTCLQHLGSAQVEYEKRRFAFLAAQ